MYFLNKSSCQQAQFTYNPAPLMCTKNNEKKMIIAIPLSRLQEIYDTYKKNRSKLSSNPAVEPLLASIKLTFAQHKGKAVGSTEIHDRGFMVIDTKEHHRQVAFNKYFAKASPTGSATDTLVFELLCGGNQYIQEYFLGQLVIRDAKSAWDYINSDQANKYQALYSTGFFDELDDLYKLKNKTFKDSRINLFINNKADVFLSWADQIVQAIDPSNSNQHNLKILRAKLLATLALTSSIHNERDNLYKELKEKESSETADEYRNRVFSTIEEKTELPIVTISKKHLDELSTQLSKLSTTLSTRIPDSTPDLNREVLLELMSQLSVIVRQLENTSDEAQIILPNSIVTHCENLLDRPNNGNPNIDVLFFAYALISDNGTQNNIAEKYQILERTKFEPLFGASSLGDFQAMPEYTEENLRAIFSITNTTLRTQLFVSLEKLRSMNCWRNYDAYEEKLNRPFHQINKAALEQLKPNDTAHTAHIIMILSATVNGLGKIQKLKFKEAVPYLNILITKNPLLDYQRNLANIVEALKLIQPNAPASYVFMLENQNEKIFMQNFYLNISELESIFDNEEQAVAQQQRKKLHKALQKFNQLTVHKKEKGLGLGQNQDQETDEQISKYMPSITEILNKLAACRKNIFHKIEQDITFKLLAIALSPVAEEYFSDNNINRIKNIFSDHSFRECDLLKAIDQPSELPGITIMPEKLQAIYDKYVNTIAPSLFGERKVPEAIRPIFDRVKNAVKTKQPLFLNPMLYFSLDFEPGFKNLVHSTDNRAAAQIDFLLEILCEGNTEHAQKLKLSFDLKKFSHKIYFQIFSDPDTKVQFFQGLDTNKIQSANQFFSRNNQARRVAQCTESFANSQETGRTEEKPEKTLTLLGVTENEMKIQAQDPRFGL